MRKTSSWLMLSLFVLFLLPFGASAFTTKAGEIITTDKTEVIEGNFYTAGNNLTIEGKITGDLICAGQSININGEVDGDVICAGQTININGKVGGSVRVLATSLNLNGQVGKNLMFAGANLSTTANSNVGGETLFAVATADLRGKIAGDLSAAASSISLGGEVDKNVRLRFDNRQERRWNDQPGLTVLGNTLIGGNLSYTDRTQANIASSSKIVGKIDYNQSKTPEANKGGLIALWLWGRVYAIFATIIIGLVLVSLWGEEIVTLTEGMFKNIGRSFGWGLVALLLTPVIAILLIFTLIGLPLALLLILFWVIAIWLSKIFVAIFVGRTFMERYWKKKKSNLILSMVIGVTISWIIFSIPVIGWIASFLAILWGMGGLILFFRKA